MASEAVWGWNIVNWAQSNQWAFQIRCGTWLYYFLQKLEKKLEAWNPKLEAWISNSGLGPSPTRAWKFKARRAWSLKKSGPIHPYWSAPLWLQPKKLVKIFGGTYVTSKYILHNDNVILYISYGFFNYTMNNSLFLLKVHDAQVETYNRPQYQFFTPTSMIIISWFFL